MLDRDGFAQPVSNPGEHLLRLRKLPKQSGLSMRVQDHDPLTGQDIVKGPGVRFDFERLRSQLMIQVVVLFLRAGIPARTLFASAPSLPNPSHRFHAVGVEGMHSFAVLHL